MYRKSVNMGGFTRIEDGSYIPDDPNNMDYIRVLEWLDAGNSPEIVPEVLPSFERQKSDEYLKQKGATSTNDIMMEMLEAIVAELDARGKSETQEFHAALKLVQDVRGKVQRGRGQ